MTKLRNFLNRRLDILYPVLSPVLFFIFVFSSSFEAFAQNQTILSGIVVDGKSHEPLIGSSIRIKGTSKGSGTDIKGEFKLIVEKKLPVTLIISSIGYRNQEIVIYENEPLKINLAVDVNQLNQVVVVGYGTQKAKELTGSISSLKFDKLESQPVGQFSQKIQGRIPGVQIIQGTGMPGEGMSIRIRGAASINAGNNPLYVIDGLPIVGDINNINPSEIENFSALKGSAATSLYGSRAANGVILITTKKGKQDQTSVTLSISKGITSVPQKGRPELLNAKEFLQFEKEIYEDKSIYEGYKQGIPELYKNPELWNGPNTDWYDVILRQGEVSNYNLTITSGKDKFNTATTFGYFKEDGVVLNTDYERFSLRTNNEYKINNAITIGLDIAPSFQSSQNFNTDGNGLIIYKVLSTAPIFSPFATDENGKLVTSFSAPGLAAQPNWYRVFTDSENRTKKTRILSNAYLEAVILKDLNFKSSASVDFGSQNRKEWNPSTVGTTFSIPPTIATAAYETQFYYSWLTENTLKYKKTFAEDHNLNALAGFSSQNYRLEYNKLTGTNFPDDAISWIDAAATKSGSNYSSEWSLLSFFSRVNYDFKGKYLFSSTFRRDGSSRFGSRNRWGSFPSASAGWVVTEEDFAKDWKTLSFLKLRGEYGYTGNFEIGNYSQYGVVTTTNYVFGNALSQGRSATAIGNSELTWETTKGLGVGLDVSLFKNRVSLNFDYYNKNTENMLYQIDIPNGSGYSSIQSNIGAFKFWGYEFNVNSKNFEGNFSWTTDFNIAFNRNKAIQLGTNNTPIGGTTEQGETSYWRTEVGKPLGQFYGYVWDGVYMTQEDFNNSAKHATSTVGTFKVKDLNDDSVINSLDKTYIGNPNPDFVFGFNNAFAYKNFDLNISITGSYGNDVFAFRGWNNILEGIFNVQKDLKDRWRSLENPGAGIQPRTLAGTAEFGRFTSSRWVHDGSYLSVKNITMGYTVPKIKKYVKSARVYASIQNPFVFTKYKYGNPEASLKGQNGLQLGLDGTAYPVPRTFALGVDITF